jgi:hypothetical protein
MAFYGTRRFVTIFASLDLVPIISQIKPADAIPSYSFKIYLIVSSHMQQDLPKVLFSLKIDGQYNPIKKDEV